MKKRRFPTLLVFIAFIYCTLLYGQDRVSDHLEIDQIFSSEFAPDHFGPMQWLAQGESYTTVEDGQIIAYDCRTSDRTVLVTREMLTPKGDEQPISIANYSWSLDENSLLLFTNTQRVWRKNTRGDYWVLHLDDQNLVQLGKSLPESSLMFAKFSPDGEKVAYVSESNIYLENPGTQDLTQLTFDGNRDVINGTFDWAYEEEFFCQDGFRWNQDGTAIAFWQVDASEMKNFLMINNTDSIYPYTIPIQYPKVGHAPSPARIGIIELQPSNQQISWLDLPGHTNQDYLPRIQWLDSDKLLIAQLNRKQNHLRLFVKERSSEFSRIIYEEKNESWIDLLHFDVTAIWKMTDAIVLDGGDSFLWVTEAKGWRKVHKISTVARPVIDVTPGEFDIASVRGYDSENQILYFIASPDNATERYLYSSNLGKANQIRRITPTENIGINKYDVSPNGRFAIHRHTNTDSPESASTISIPDHTPVAHLYSNQHLKEYMRQPGFPSTEYFSIVTADGIEMDGYLTKPADFDPSVKYPLIFHVYGEPAATTAKSAPASMWHNLLAQRGYLIATLDNRGTPTLKGAAWRKSIYRKLGHINAHDQAQAAQELIKWDFVDADRIGVWGWSGGGAMTLNLMFKHPEIYQTGIAIAAVTNQLYYDNIYQERYMGLPSENREDFISGSPAEHVDGLEGNLLYIHGTADDNVHYQNAEHLINKLIEHNKLFDLMIYPNRSHGIREGAGTTRHLYNTMTNYFLKHLPAGPK